MNREQRFVANTCSAPSDVGVPVLPKSIRVRARAFL